MGFELPFVIGPEYIAVALFGVVIGIIFGAIPGMTATMAVAVFLPLTYAYSMEMALYLLLGLYVGGISGGLVPRHPHQHPRHPFVGVYHLRRQPHGSQRRKRARPEDRRHLFLLRRHDLSGRPGPVHPPSWPAGPSSSPPWRSSSSSCSPSPLSPPCPVARCSAVCGSACWACWLL